MSDVDVSDVMLADETTEWRGAAASLGALYTCQQKEQTAHPQLDSHILLVQSMDSNLRQFLQNGPQLSHLQSAQAL